MAGISTFHLWKHLLSKINPKGYLMTMTRFKKWSEFCHHPSIQKFCSYKDMIHNIKGFIIAQCHKEQLLRVTNAITTIFF